MALSGSSFRIGTKGTNISYPRGQSVFHRSDIPEHARKRADAVKDYRRNDILGLKKPQWNTSTDAGEKLCVRKHRLLSRGERDVYRFNYRAEVPPTKEPEYAPRANKFQIASVTMEPDPDRRASLVSANRTLRRNAEHPVHPRLEGKPGWNSSIVMNSEERRALIEEQEKRRLMNSTIKSQRLRGYKSPLARYEESVQLQRRQTITRRGGAEADRLNRLAVVE